MTPQERTAQIILLLLDLESCHKLGHGGVISDEQIQALRETVDPPRVIDDEVVEETRIG